MGKPTLYEILSRIHGIPIDRFVYITNGVSVERIGTLNDVIRQVEKVIPYLDMPVDSFFFTNDIWVNIKDYKWRPKGADDEPKRTYFA